MDWVKKHRKLLLLNLILLLLCAVCILGYAYVSNVLYHIDSAKNWEGESDLNYSYISCFMPVNGKIDENAIYSFRETVNSKMTEASLEASENANLWNFAYSGTGMVNVSTERASAEVNATGVGGEFFFFHQPFLRDGSYISGSDLMKDSVVIDKALAWKLFGATEVAGMELLINGNRYRIAGVIEPEDDFASKRAKTADGGLYMAFEKLEALSKAGISCYEAVIPNPVKGFAMNVANENFPAENCEIIEVSERYGIKNMISVMGSFGLRSMRTDGIIFPEWENAARLTEDYCAAFLLFAVVFAAVPLAFAAALMRKYGKIFFDKAWIFIKGKAEKFKDDFDRRIYERNLAEKAEKENTKGED